MSSNKPSLNDQERRALSALSVVGGTDDWFSAYAVAENARMHGIEFTASNLRNILSRLKTHVEFRTVSGTRRFRLKRAGLIQTGGGTTEGNAFIRPGTPWSSASELRKFLGANCRTFLLVIDPYISEDTLDVLGDVDVGIRIVASNLGRKNKEAEFARAYKKFNLEKKGQVELRQCPAESLHGRYIITDGRGWVIDHSLQDIGTKPALILPMDLGDVFPATKQHFEKVFLAGTLVPPA